MPELATELARLFGTAWHVNGTDIAKRLGETTYAGDPTNNLVPEFIGQLCRDTSGAHLYWASTAASSGWKKLNN